MNEPEAADAAGGWADLVHWLNNDLVVIIGHLDLLLERPALPSDERRHAQTALDRAALMAERLRVFHQMHRSSTTTDHGDAGSQLGDSHCLSGTKL